MRRRHVRALRIRRWAGAALAAAVLVAWLVPSDVVALVVRQEDVLLGRYSEGRFVGLVAFTLLTLPSAWMLALGTRPSEVATRMALVTVACAAGFGAMSLAARVSLEPRYVEVPVAEQVADPVGLHGTTRHRQPGQVFHMRRKDRPGPARSYPAAPPGFPAAEIRLASDADGFRNVDPCDPCDVVVVGDSFSEGSMVSDDEVWTARYAGLVGTRVGNYAVSGATPNQYLNNLVAFGLPRDPALVVVTVFEGNDFKRHGGPSDAPPGSDGIGHRVRATWRAAFKGSPLRARIKRSLLKNLGAIGSGARLPESLALSWMPVTAGPEGRPHRYAFEPKHMLRLDWEPERFRGSPHWTTNAEVFTRIQAVTAHRGARLLMVYVPSKPHVLLPLLRASLDAEALHAFAVCEEDDLPPPRVFREQLFERLDTQERVFFGYCAERGIDCLSLTAPLRAAIAAGEPAYFTYDPHWTRVGHEVAARAVAAHAPEASR